MTMNTRQAGAFTELIKKEEKAREQWNATHGVAYAERAQQAARARAQAESALLAAQGNGFGATMQQTQQQFQPFQTQQQQQQQPLYMQPLMNGTQSLSYGNGVGGGGYSSARSHVADASPRSLSTLTGMSSSRVSTHMVPHMVRSVGVVEEDALTEREEQYQELVPVLKTRRVSVPVKRLREVDRWVEVLAPEQRVIDDGNTNANGNGPASYRSTSSSQGPHSARYSYGGPTFEQQQQLQRPMSARSAHTGYGYSPRQFEQHSNPYTGQTHGGAARLGFKVRASNVSAGQCVVCEVEAAAPAGRAGLRPGDVLVSTNGQRVSNLQDVKNAIANSRGPVLMQVKRGADRFVVTLQR